MKDANQIYNELQIKYDDFLAANAGVEPSVIVMNRNHFLTLCVSNNKPKDATKPSLRNPYLDGLQIIIRLENDTFDYDYFDSNFMSKVKDFKSWEVPIGDEKKGKPRDMVSVHEIELNELI